MKCCLLCASCLQFVGNSHSSKMENFEYNIDKNKNSRDNIVTVLRHATKTFVAIVNQCILFFSSWHLNARSWVQRHQHLRPLLVHASCCWELTRKWWSVFGVSQRGFSFLSLASSCTPWLNMSSPFHSGRKWYWVWKEELTSVDVVTTRNREHGQAKMTWLIERDDGLQLCLADISHFVWWRQAKQTVLFWLQWCACTHETVLWGYGFSTTFDCWGGESEACQVSGQCHQSSEAVCRRFATGDMCCAHCSSDEAVCFSLAAAFLNALWRSYHGRPKPGSVCWAHLAWTRQQIGSIQGGLNGCTRHPFKGFMLSPWCWETTETGVNCWQAALESTPMSCSGAQSHVPARVLTHDGFSGWKWMLRVVGHCQCVGPTIQCEQLAVKEYWPHFQLASSRYGTFQYPCNCVCSSSWWQKRSCQEVWCNSSCFELGCSCVQRGKTYHWQGTQSREFVCEVFLLQVCCCLLWRLYACQWGSSCCTDGNCHTALVDGWCLGCHAESFAFGGSVWQSVANPCSLCYIQSVIVSSFASCLVEVKDLFFSVLEPSEMVLMMRTWLFPKQETYVFYCFHRCLDVQFLK